MGSKDVVNYKVILYRKQGGEDDDKEQLEIRRFSVAEEVSSSFGHLSQKLSSIFPILLQHRWSMTWLDSEGDEVTVRTDEELAMALAEMEGPLRRISVCYGGEEIPSLGGGSKGSGVSEGGNSDGPTHPGVVCDECDSRITGFRYKCVQCADYDLCGRCETKGLHAGHNMMRIADPDRAWPRHFFARLGKMHERINKREASAGGRPEVPPSPFVGSTFAESDPRFLCDFGGPGPWGRVNHTARHPRGSYHPSWRSDAVEARIEKQASREADRAMRQLEHATRHATAHAEAVWRNHNAASKAKADAAKAKANDDGNGGAKVAEDKVPDSSDFLANIGQVVAAALDPFGINVQVGVEDKGRVRNVSLPKRKQDDKEAVGKTEEEAAEEPESPKEEPPKDEEKKAEEAEKSSCADGEWKGEFEWTILNDSHAKEGKGEEEAQAKETVVQIQVEKAPGKEALYPKLTEEDKVGKPSAPPKEAEEKQQQQGAAAIPVAKHEDPKVQVALQAMMNMGFKDDGGWLTQLLESKGGDIGKVLDILQPVANVRK